jgi:lipopolysaccharide export system protein LptC
MTRLRDVGEAVSGLLSPQASANTHANAETGSSAPQIHRDWTARPRDTILSALRYTQFVGWMKRILPISAGIVVAAVLAFFFLQRAPEGMTLSYESTGRIDNDLAMIKPRLVGTDDAGNPFVITANAAIQDGKNAKRARLEKVEADIQADKGHWLNASATRGTYDMDAGTLVLRDGLSVFSDDGYELHTAQADVDLKKGEMTGPEVTGQGPLGSLRADTFKVDRISRRLQLSGNVHMTLSPK